MDHSLWSEGQPIKGNQQNVTPDPWARWQGPRPQASALPLNQVRSTDGPTETRLTAQDKKLDNMEQQLRELVKAQEQFAQKTEQRFAAAEEREKNHHQHVAKTMDAVKVELTRSLSRRTPRSWRIVCLS